MVIPLNDWIISICLCACLLHHNWHQWKVLVLVLVGAHSALLAAGYIHAVLLLSVQLPFVWLIYLFSCTLSRGISCLLSVELPHCHWVVNWWWWRWSAWDAGWFNCLSTGCTGLPWGWWQCTVCVWLLGSLFWLTMLSHCYCHLMWHYSCWNPYCLKSLQSPWLIRSQGSYVMSHCHLPHCCQHSNQCQAHCHDPLGSPWFHALAGKSRSGSQGLNAGGGSGCLSLIGMNWLFCTGLLANVTL